MKMHIVRQRLARLESRVIDVTSLSNVDLDLCINLLERQILCVDGESVETHPEDERVMRLLQRSRTRGASHGNRIV